MHVIVRNQQRAYCHVKTTLPLVVTVKVATWRIERFGRAHGVGSCETQSDQKEH